MALGKCFKTLAFISMLFSSSVSTMANDSGLTSDTNSSLDIVKMKPVTDDDFSSSNHHIIDTDSFEAVSLDQYLGNVQEGVNQNGVQTHFKKSDFRGNATAKTRTVPAKHINVAAKQPVPSNAKIETDADDMPEYDDIAAAFDPRDLKCMTQVLYHEARGEQYPGMVAVGNVIINRMNNPEFPRTVCGVMNQKSGKTCQFSFVCNGRLNIISDRNAWSKAEKIAKQVLSGDAPDHGGKALFFHAAGISPKWFASLGKGTRIGSHFFYQ